MSKELIVSQIGSDRDLGYRFVIAPEGTEIALKQDEYIDTTTDAEGWFGGPVTVITPAHSALVEAANYIPEQVDLTLPRFKDADDGDTVTLEVTIGWLREVRDALAEATEQKG